MSTRHLGRQWRDSRCRASCCFWLAVRCSTSAWSNEPVASADATICGGSEFLCLTSLFRDRAFFQAAADEVCEFGEQLYSLACGPSQTSPAMRCLSAPKAYLARFRFLAGFVPA
jgi:hypothetical protein